MNSTRQLVNFLLPIITTVTAISCGVNKSDSQHLNPSNRPYKVSCYLKATTNQRVTTRMVNNLQYVQFSEGGSGRSTNLREACEKACKAAKTKIIGMIQWNLEKFEDNDGIKYNFQLSDAADLSGNEPIDCPSPSTLITRNDYYIINF